MNTEMETYIAHTGSMEWQLLIEEGIDTTGISVKALRFDPIQNRPPSILLKFEPGAQYPYHNHPGGEEIFVMEGSCIIEGTTLHKGDYLYTPAGFKHAVTTITGCVLMLIIPEEVVIIK